MGFHCIRGNRFCPARGDLWLSPDGDICREAGSGVSEDGGSKIEDGIPFFFTIRHPLFSILKGARVVAPSAWELHVITLRKVISGGQTGVDQAALRAAKDCGLEVGGWCPPGRICEAGVIPQEFSLQETERDRSPHAPEVPRSQRTEWNVRDSHGSLVLVAFASGETAPADPGTQWTIRCAQRLGRPLLVQEISDPDAERKIREWLTSLPIKVLNVAGPSESSSPGIDAQTYALLKRVFEKL